MLIVAKYFRWKEDRMNEWFDRKEKLEFELGIKPLPSTQNDPKMSQSLLKNNPDMECPTCYEPMEEG